MHRPKSQRHVNAANARWRRDAAQAERDAGIPDEPSYAEFREPFDMPLKCVGYRDLRLEPRLGYVAWRAIDSDTGEVVHAAALKELLRWIAGKVPRMMSPGRVH